MFFLFLLFLFFIQFLSFFGYIFLQTIRLWIGKNFKTRLFLFFSSLFLLPSHEYLMNEKSISNGTIEPDVSVVPFTLKKCNRTINIYFELDNLYYHFLLALHNNWKTYLLLNLSVLLKLYIYYILKKYIYKQQLVAKYFLYKYIIIKFLN